MNGVLNSEASGASSQIDNLISLHLHLWPALTVAIQNAWGTSSPALGADKRAWFAGAISDLFTQNQIRDLEDLEDIMEQVMSDEFEVVVDDDSLEETARGIWSGRAKILQGDASEVTRLMAVWEEKKNKKTKLQVVQGPDVDQDTDDEEDDDTWNGFPDSNDEDVDMDEAPALVDVFQPKKKPEPEIDEDGFTKVAGKKKR
jgi:pre-rRNA-processing protein TSR2